MFYDSAKFSVNYFMYYTIGFGWINRGCSPTLVISLCLWKMRQNVNFKRYTYFEWMDSKTLVWTNDIVNELLIQNKKLEVEPMELGKMQRAYYSIDEI